MTQLTSQIFLNIALGAGFLILVLFLCIALVYVIKILRNMSQMTETAKDTVDKVHEFVLEPIAIIREVYDKIKPYVSMFHEKSENVKEKVEGAFRRKNRKHKHEKESEE